MPVPNSMADLSTLASSNFPTGTESIGNNLDNYIRSHAAIIRSTNAISSATIASASTTDLASADGEQVTVTGSTTINSFGSGFPGCYREVYFQGAPLILQSSNILTPSGVNLNVTAGSVLGIRCISSGVWRITVGNGYIPANKAGDIFTGTVGVVGGRGTLYSPADGQFGIRASNDANTVQAYFTFYNNGDFAALQGRVLASTQVWAQGGRIIATQGTPAVFPTGLASGLDMQPSGRGQLFAYNYGNSTYAPMDYNASIHVFNSDITTSGNLISTSDERLKDNWRPLAPDFIERLVDVKHGIYERTDSGETQVGVGAQSLREVLPEAVFGGDSLAVAYGNAALVAVIEVAKRVLKLEEGR